MRLYSVAVCSLVVNAPAKWMDNLLSQHDIPGVAHRDRGLPRGVSWHALVRIGLIRILSHELGCSVRDAVALAERLMDRPEMEIVDVIAIRFDRSLLEVRLQERLNYALETAPRPRRGRPPRRARVV